VQSRPLNSHSPFFLSTWDLLNRIVLTVGALDNTTPMRPEKETTASLFIATKTGLNAFTQLQ